MVVPQCQILSPDPHYSGMGNAVAVVSGILAEEEEFRGLVRELPYMTSNFGGFYDTPLSAKFM